MPVLKEVAKREPSSEDTSLEHMLSAKHLAKFIILFSNPEEMPLRSAVFRNEAWDYYQGMYPYVKTEDVYSTRVIAKHDDQVFQGIKDIRHWLPYDLHRRRYGNVSQMSVTDIEKVAMFANGRSEAELRESEREEWIPTDASLRRLQLGMASGMRVIATIYGIRGDIMNPEVAVRPQVEETIVSALQLTDEELSIARNLELRL